MVTRSKAKLTSKGQLTLPVLVRRTLGVNRGDEVIFEVAAGQVTVIPSPLRNCFRKVIGRFRIGMDRTAADIDVFVGRLRGRR